LRAILEHNEQRSGWRPHVVVPHGVEDLVDSLGFTEVHTLRWWDVLRIGGLQIIMTSAQHWGKRYFNDDHRGYGGYVLAAGDYSVYHSGDTAYFDGFHEVARLKPQIALLPIGAYSPDAVRSVHTTPEDALQAFLDVGAEQMIPMHYGTFRLSHEPVDEPLRRLQNAARRRGVENQVTVLREGQTLLVSRERLPAMTASSELSSTSRRTTFICCDGSVNQFDSDLAFQ